MLEEIFPYMPPERDAAAWDIYQALFSDLDLEQWMRQGTVLTRPFNGRKLNFAARRRHCTIGFRGHAAVEFYQGVGGRCPVGEVTIKIPYGKAFDVALVQSAIDWYAHNQPIGKTAGEMRWP